jgi:hypothetical protein
MTNCFNNLFPKAHIVQLSLYQLIFWLSMLQSLISEQRPVGRKHQGFVLCLNGKGFLSFAYDIMDHQVFIGIPVIFYKDKKAALLRLFAI